MGAKTYYLVLYLWLLGGLGPPGPPSSDTAPESNYLDLFLYNLADSEFSCLNNNFLSHLKYLPYISIEKILLIQENPKFSITKTVNCSFIILPSTELDFFNYFSFLTFVRIPGNQNWRLLVSFLFLFWNSHSELLILCVTT